ncbi:uncharacterized protein V6R79_012590 [Siganus canaliculatus]
MYGRVFLTADVNIAKVEGDKLNWILVSLHEKEDPSADLKKRPSSCLVLSLARHLVDMLDRCLGPALSMFCCVVILQFHTHSLMFISLLVTPAIMHHCKRENPIMGLDDAKVLCTESSHPPHWKMQTI